MQMPLWQAFLDAFSANRVFYFAETLCFLSWLLSFFLNIFKKAPFPLKNWLFLQYFYVDLVFYANFNHFSVFSPIYPLILINFCCYFFQILPKPWVFCLIFELFSWGLSFFILEFFSNSPKKPALWAKQL